MSTMYKKVNRAGAITIPAQLRNELNIHKGSAVEVNADGDMITIKKHIPTCIMCHTADNVTVIDGIEMCEYCASKFIRPESEAQ